MHRKGLQQFVISEYYEKVFIVSNCQASFNSLFHDFFFNYTFQGLHWPVIPVFVLQVSQPDYLSQL